MFSIVLKCELSFEDSADDKDVYTTIVKIPGTASWEAASEGKNAKEIDFVSILINDMFRYVVTVSAFPSRPPY